MVARPQTPDPKNAKETLMGEQTLAQQAAERLGSWIDDFSIGRYEKPTYANPGELKADLRVLLALLADTERERDEADADCAKAWQAHADEEAATEAAEARVAELEAALRTIADGDIPKRRLYEKPAIYEGKDVTAQYVEEQTARQFARAALAAADPKETPA